VGVLVGRGWVGVGGGGEYGWVTVVGSVVGVGVIVVGLVVVVGLMAVGRWEAVVVVVVVVVRLLVVVVVVVVTATGHGTGGRTSTAAAGWYESGTDPCSDTGFGVGVELGACGAVVFLGPSVGEGRGCSAWVVGVGAEEALLGGSEAHGA